MLFNAVSIFLALAAGVHAHFQLQFPAPRGPFVAKNEVNFCDSYPTSENNRSIFPLENGFFSFKSGHPRSTTAVLISIDQDPTTFAEFNTSSNGVQLPFAKPFFELDSAGTFCFPLSINDLGIPGVSNGTNVTIQVMYNGGDGNLFQCSDLTLVDGFTIPSNVSCSNATATTSTTATYPSSTATASSTSGADAAYKNWFTGVLAIGFAASLGLVVF